MPSSRVAEHWSSEASSTHVFHGKVDSSDQTGCTQILINRNGNLTLKMVK